MTGGRTRAGGESPFDVVTIVVVTGRRPPEYVRLSPEQQRLLELCRAPHTVADLASDSTLPLCVVEVLVGDLLEISRPVPDTRQREGLLRMVIDELREL